MFHVDEAWMQHGLDVLDEMFRVDDATKRDMIEFLFHEGFWHKDKLSWAAAVARFNDCLNPNKTQFFKLSELWALAKAFRRHSVMHAMAEDLEYQPLRMMPTEERRQLLLERLATAQEKLLALMMRDCAELEELDASPAARRIHPAVREGRALFSLDKDTSPLKDDQDADVSSGRF